MNLPFTLKFFKKIELFQDLEAQDKLFKYTTEIPDNTHATLSTWEAEKKVLYWSRWGHKHLGSPLVIHRFEHQPDLEDLGMTMREVEKAGLRESMRNLVERGFARFDDPKQKENGGILLTREGLLMGELIYETHRLEKIGKGGFWETYSKTHEAQHHLGRTWKYYLYKVTVSLGWVVTFLGLLVLLKTLLTDLLDTLFPLLSRLGYAGQNLR